MRKKLLVVCLAAAVLALASPGMVFATLITGGDAPSEALADSVVDIVFTIDTSGSMFDDINAIGNVARDAIETLECPHGDIWARARFMGITGTYGSLFNETIYDYTSSPISNHVEDCGPIINDLINHYSWTPPTGGQSYFKAIVSIGDEGTENGYGVYQSDWDAAYSANQAAITADVLVFGWVADPYPGVANLFEKMAVGGSGGGYTFGDTGGAFLNYNAGQGGGPELKAKLQEIVCQAGGGGVIPEPSTFVVWSLLLAASGIGMVRYRRRKRG
jgi:hypothetical protein